MTVLKLVCNIMFFIFGAGWILQGVKDSVKTYSKLLSVISISAGIIICLYSFTIWFMVWGVRYE